MIACMGGWCCSRDRCANYYAPMNNHFVERLCGEVEEPEPVLQSQRRMDGCSGVCQRSAEISAYQG